MRLFIVLPQVGELLNCPAPMQRVYSFTTVDYKNQTVHLTQHQCLYRVRITARDLHNTSSQEMYFGVYNTIPYLYRPIYTLNNQVTEYLLNVGVYLDFILNFDTFKDHDQSDQLQMNATMAADGKPLPSWLSFNQQIKRFSGTAKKNQLSSSDCPSGVKDERKTILDPTSKAFNKVIDIKYCDYHININVTDGCYYTNSDFTIRVINHAPFKYDNIINDLEIYELHISNRLGLEIPYSSIFDLDESDTVKIEVRVTNFTREDSWIKYNSQQRKLFGQLTPAEFTGNCLLPASASITSKDWDEQDIQLTQRKCIYEVVLNASDYVACLDVTIHIHVYNTEPYLNRPVYYYEENQQAVVVKLNRQLDFYLPIDSFSEFDQADNLQFSAELRNSSNNNTWPQWLLFDAQFKRFTGIPTLYDFLELCPQLYDFKLQWYLSDYQDYQKNNITLLKGTCNYTIWLQARDTVSGISLVINIVVENTAPHQQYPFYTEMGLEAIFKHNPNQMMDYTIPLYCIADADNDYITYKMSYATNNTMPSWLSFSEDSRLMHGRPSIEHVNLYNLSINVSDGCFPAVFYFLVRVSNKKPQAVGAVAPIMLDFGDFINIELPTNEVYFFDEDGDKLNYDAQCLEVGGNMIPLQRCSGWLFFKKERIYLYGQADKDFSTVIKPGSEPGVRYYLAEYQIQIIARDSSNEEDQIGVFITVQHLIPRLNTSNYVQFQLDRKLQLSIEEGGVSCKQGVEFDFIFDLNSFVFSGQIQLYSAKVLEIPAPTDYRYDQFYETEKPVIKSQQLYAAQQADYEELFGEGKVQGIGDSGWTQIYVSGDHWLQFDQLSRRFYGIVPLKRVSQYIIRLDFSDTYDTVHQYLHLIPRNKKPYVNQEHLQSFNTSFNLLKTLQLSMQNLMLDQDQDNITYKIYIQRLNSTSNKLIDTPIEITAAKNNKFWAKYDATRQLMSGKPDPKTDLKRITFNKTLNQYFQIYMVSITGYDTSQESASCTLFIDIHNSPPYKQNTTIE